MAPDRNARIASCCRWTLYEGSLIFVKVAAKKGRAAASGAPVRPRKAPPKATRKLPTRDRGRRRVEAILDAASVLFAEQGFDAVTMEAISARAATAIGSLYQFFPNKRSVFEAIAERSLERSRATFEALSGAAVALPWEALVDAAVDGFAHLHGSDPGFRAVLTNLQLYGVYAEADAALHALIVDQVAARITGVAPHVASARRAIVAEVVVSTVAAMLFLSQRQPPATARAMRDETKRLVRAYVASVIAAQPSR